SDATRLTTVVLIAAMPPGLPRQCHQAHHSGATKLITVVPPGSLQWCHQADLGSVLGFARARGYGAVVLETSVVQVAAQRLYEGQGFRKVGAFSPSLLGRLLYFQVFRYRCELPAAPGAPPAPPGRPAAPPSPAQ
uniref:N-acetyltransferase domain-containing protein n=1 Tax=Dromaius novaehollandiae TaxID=8790 RepID=A0A8C4JQU9_DRONO